MTQHPLPDFASLYKRSADTLRTADSPDAPVTDPPEKDKLPDFTSLYAKPGKTEKEIAYDAINKSNNDAYDKMGIKPGALRGFIDFLPDALNQLAATTTDDAITAVKGQGSNLAEMGSQLVEHPVDASVALGKTMGIELARLFVQTPVELIFNKQINMGDDLTKLDENRTLTPEDRDKRARSFGGNLVAMAMGLKAEHMVSSAMIGQEAIIGGKGLKAVSEAIETAKKIGVLSEARVVGAATADVVDAAFSPFSTQQLVKLRDAIIAPTYIRNVASGSIGGATEGFATGYFEGGTPAERLQAGLAYAMVAMPIGVAMTSVGAMLKLASPVGDMTEMIQMQAGQIAKLRQMSATTNMTPAEVLFNLNNLQENQSMAAAMALRDLEYVVVGQNKDGMPLQYGKNASVIPSVENPAEVMRIVAEHNALPDNSGAVSVAHTRKDGTVDVLIAPKDTPMVEQSFFERTGFVHGQQVSYGGRDQWVIERQGVPDGKRTYRMELRDLATDERVKDVKPSDIVKLSSREPGDLRLHLGRVVTRSGIYNVAQGFSAKGPIDIGEHKGPIDSWRVSVANQMEMATGSNVSFAEGKVWLDGQPLAPGVHKIEVDIKDVPMYAPEEGKSYAVPEGGKRGAIIHVGGELVDSFDAEGKPIKIMSGSPGEVTAVLDWYEEKGYGGQLRKGSNNFFSFFDTPNRHLGTDAIKKARIEMGLDRSLSYLSKGGSKSLMNALNRFGRDRQVAGTLTTYTPEVLMTRMFEDFLDHVGATPDGRLLISPDDVITMAGWERSNTWNSPAENHTVGQRGQSRETILSRLGQSRLDELKGDGIPRLFTDSKRPLTLKESVALMREQMTANSVPTLRTLMDRAIDRTEVPFNALINSFVTAQGIRPEFTTSVRNFVEYQLGKSLLGEPSARARLADRTSIPVLQGEVDRAERAVTRLTKLTQLASETEKTKAVTADWKAKSVEQLTQLKEAEEIVEVFKARIKQIEEAGPLPFTPEERTTYSRLVTEAQAQRHVDAGDLVQTAHGNGFVVDVEEGGAIILRNAESWEKMPQRFSDAASARDFINATGKAIGVELDGGGNNVIPPSAVAGPGMLPPGPQPRLYEAPHQFAPDSRISKVMTYLDTIAPWITPKRAFMIALDTSFKTQLHDKVYLPLQIAKMKLESLKRPSLVQLKEIEDILIANKLDPKRKETISQYRESRSPQQVIDSYYKNRKLTQAEVEYAQRLVDKNIDIHKVYGYSRAVSELNKGYKSELAELEKQLKLTEDPVALAQINTEVKALGDSHANDIEGAKSAFIMDDNHLAAVDMFTEVKARPINEAALEGVTRLARSIQNGESNRAGFAAKNKMTAAELSAATKLDKLYSDVARRLGIDERITNYFNHFRTYTDAPDTSPARLKAATMRGTLDEMPGLAAEMIRSGEMNVYELDPVKAAMQYINTGYANRHFNETWKAARNSAVEALQQIPKGREAAARVLDEYVGGMKGTRVASDELAEAAFGKFWTALGYEPTPEARRGFVDTFLAATSGAYLGFRPAQGIRDLTQFTKIYYSRFGASRYKNGFELAFKRDADGNLALKKLAEDGIVPGLSVLQFATDAELADGMAGKAGKVKDAIFNASAAGLTVSGQHNAYALAHAIAYLDTKDLAQKSLLDLSRGKLTKEQAYKKLGMNSYDLPVAEGFDRLVTDGKFDQAGEYLAQATGTETAFIFGLQNHPYGWGTGVGKLAGQFGTWSVWTRNYLTRLAGRGTAGERAAAMARFASVELATGVAGRALGFNVRSWYLLPGIVFMGGPAMDHAEQITDATGARGQMKQDLAQKQLTRGPIPVLGRVLPGSSALNDYLEAYELSQQRFGPIPVLGKALGFAVDKTQRSFFDEWMGNRPRLGR